MLHGTQQRADRMSRCSGSEILGRDVQVDLRAGDLPMSEEITNGYEPNAFAHEVSRKSVAHAVR